MADHFLGVTPETVHWGYWDASLKPVLSVRSGDRVTIDSVSGGREHLPADEAGVRPEHLQIIENVRQMMGPHALTGPVWVEGAEVGDVLEVRIHDIRLADSWGFNVLVPLGGTLPEEFPYASTVHYPLDRERMTARLPWGVDLPLRPFFGNFGVAPRPEFGRISSKEPRAHGGNMDNKELLAGSTIYFPVWNKGALFSAGDGHAVQGDGEVCQTALETGMIGTFELIVRKDLDVDFPRAETATHLISMGMNADLDDAATQSVREMVDWVCELSNLSREDAYRLCSLAGDLRVTQVVDGNKGIHCLLDKSLF